MRLPNAKLAAAVLSTGVLAVACASTAARNAPGSWTPEELQTLRSLWLGGLEPLPPDPSNRFADDEGALRLGHALFFDTRLSADGAVSCATCHLPELGFQDGVPLAEGVGTTDRRTMTVIGTAYSPWLFWDGRKDSQWSQALGPLESAVEHGGDRTFHVRMVAENHAELYEAVFGPLPPLEHLPRRAGPVVDAEARVAWTGMAPEDREAVNRAFANLGKAIAAYQRRLQFAPSRFDRWVERLTSEGWEAARGLLTPEEEAGARLFIGKAQCVNCHNGPLFTDDFFHNTGVPAVRGLPRDLGRAAGAPQVREDEFNCLGPYSDASPSDCVELRFMTAEGNELVRAFKTPTLRGVAARAPYMHAGQLATLADVIAHYDRAPRAPKGRTELRRLRLTAEERARIEAFLKSLDGPVAAPEELLRAPEDLLRAPESSGGRGQDG